MSSGRSCSCKTTPKSERMKHWAVLQRNCNHSAFNGYKWTFSQYSSITCYKCKHVWRTKSDYVHTLPDYDRSKDTQVN